MGWRFPRERMGLPTREKLRLRVMGIIESSTQACKAGIGESRGLRAAPAVTAEPVSSSVRGGNCDAYLPELGKRLLLRFHLENPLLGLPSASISLPPASTAQPTQGLRNSLLGGPQDPLLSPWLHPSPQQSSLPDPCHLGPRLFLLSPRLPSGHGLFCLLAPRTGSVSEERLDARIPAPALVL